ncbi:hypothetical protein [Bacillus proteolyticus]|uniref:hypothetical protein n=1 Tax=Bacillus proteolyticus TaxID=2026192 RepID=UPI003CFBDEC0
MFSFAMTTNKETFTTTLISLKLPIIITMVLFFRFPPIIILLYDRVLSTRYRIHTNYANFQGRVERTTGYDIDQQTLVEEKRSDFKKSLILEYVFLNVYFVVAKEKHTI